MTKSKETTKKAPPVKARVAKAKKKPGRLEWLAYPASKRRTPKVVAKTEVILGMAKPASVEDAFGEVAELGPLSNAIGAAAARRRGKMTPPPAPSTAKLIVEEDAKERRAKKKEAKEEDAPRVECRLVVGDVSVPVDAASLDHTLGSGPWGHTQGYGPGLVDAWPDAAWTALLAHLKLPAFPLDRAAAEAPVKRLVQRLWYEAVQGGVPKEREAAFAERDAEAAKSYKPDFEKVEATAETRAKAGARMQAARGGPTAYEPTPHLKKNGAEAKGQAAMLFSAFKAGGFAPMTTVAAAEAMVKAGLKTTTKPERIAAFYLCQWVKTGWLARKDATA